MGKLLVDKESGESIKIKVKDIVIGGKEKVIISGPCAVESYEILLSIARELKEAGVHILRGGAYKPRTSPYSFQGLEEEGLKIISEVGKEVDLPVITEIMDTRDVEKALDYTDIIQIGSPNVISCYLCRGRWT